MISSFHVSVHYDTAETERFHFIFGNCTPTQQDRLAGSNLPTVWSGIRETPNLLINIDTRRRCFCPVSFILIFSLASCPPVHVSFLCRFDGTFLSLTRTRRQLSLFWYHKNVQDGTIMCDQENRQKKITARLRYNLYYNVCRTATGLMPPPTGA